MREAHTEFRGIALSRKDGRKVHKKRPPMVYLDTVGGLILIFFYLMRPTLLTKVVARKTRKDVRQ